METEYTPNERRWLVSLAVVGFVLLNSVFGYGLFFEPQTLMAALQNPISLVFIGEAFLMMAALAYLLVKWKVSRLHWGWFVGLSLLGSMAFALPIVLLWPYSKRTEFK